MSNETIVETQPTVSETENLPEPHPTITTLTINTLVNPPDKNTLLHRHRLVGHPNSLGPPPVVLPDNTISLNRTVFRLPNPMIFHVEAGSGSVGFPPRRIVLCISLRRDLLRRLGVM